MCDGSKSDSHALESLTSLLSRVTWGKERDLSEPQHLFLHKRNARAYVLSHNSHVQLFATLWIGALHSPLPMGLSGKNTGVGCRALLHVVFLTQGLNLRLLYLLHWQTGS